MPLRQFGRILRDNAIRNDSGNSYRRTNVAFRCRAENGQVPCRAKIAATADLVATACFDGSFSIPAIRGCRGVLVAPANHWACGKFSEGFTCF